jgi:hypothetical protein
MDVTVFRNVIRPDKNVLVTPGMHAKTHTGSHALCPLILSDFNQN